MLWIYSYQIHNDGDDDDANDGDDDGDDDIDDDDGDDDANDDDVDDGHDNNNFVWKTSFFTKTDFVNIIRKFLLMM